MTLASFFAICVFCTASWSISAATMLEPHGQNQSSSAQTPAATSLQTSSTTPKLRHHRKTKKAADCAASSESTPPTGPASASAPATNCPPAKIIVHNGGSLEPSIQLTGTEAPHQNDTAAQLLAATDNNLKKIAAHQLTSSQQDMVSQIHQFVDQSKAAVAAGDAERARTLALKAQTLSEELATPPK